MGKSYILFFDSGIGGLSTLKESMSMLKTNYIYFGDSIHSPYGSHSKEEICTYIHTTLSCLTTQYNIKIVVIACNTATTSAISYLREKFPNIIFIGTEPAVALAKKNGFDKILTIATPTTLRQEKYLNLIKSLNVQVKNLPMKHLATKIENFYFENSLNSKFQLLKELFKIKTKAKKYNCIVLGCTHYCLIKNKFKQYFDIPIFDGNYGTAKMMTSKIDKFFTNEFKQQLKSTVKLIISGKNSEQTQKYVKILNQILAIN